jgi:hypothetical protein
MLPEPLYSAAVCTQCQRASLAPGDESRSCALCGARAIAAPGGQFIEDDLPLFAELERVVHKAKLLKSEAVLIAAALESVSQRWEPPKLVLQHVSSRLVGLEALYNPKQEYSRLLSVVSVLLTSWLAAPPHRSEFRLLPAFAASLRTELRPRIVPFVGAKTDEKALARVHTPLNLLRWLTQVLLAIVVLSLLGVGYALWQIFQVKTPLPKISEIPVPQLHTGRMAATSGAKAASSPLWDALNVATQHDAAGTRFARAPTNGGLTSNEQGRNLEWSRPWPGGACHGVRFDGRGARAHIGVRLRAPHVGYQAGVIDQEGRNRRC